MINDVPVTPLNKDSRLIEVNYHVETIKGSYNTLSSSHIYMEQIPNYRIVLKPVSKRMAGLKKSGLIGCLNGSEITSINYKDVIRKSISKKNS